MRNSDPGVRTVFVHWHNSDFNSVFTLQATGCNFQLGSNFGVHSDPTFSFRCSISWESVLHDRSLHPWNARILESLSSVRLQQQHSGILHPYKFYSICLFVITSIRSPYLCNSNSLCVGSSLFKGVFVLITFGTNEELDCSPTTGLPAW